MTTIRVSRAFLDAAEQLLLESGSTAELGTLVDKTLQARPLKRGEHLIAQELYKSAKAGMYGLAVVGYPSFTLARREWPIGLSRRGYLGAAHKVLSSQTEVRQVDVREIARQAIDNRFLQTVSQVPEYWMYFILKKRPKMFIQKGDLLIGLARSRYARAERQPPTTHSRAEKRHGAAHLSERMYERDIESLVAARLDLIEDGLKLIGRQYHTPVGRIDLLCRDKADALVVVELKSFGAKTNDIIDQIARYMGYIRAHLAKQNQWVRGIIVAGEVDQGLSYAVMTIPNIEIRTFEVKIVPAHFPAALDGGRTA